MDEEMIYSEQLRKTTKTLRPCHEGNYNCVPSEYKTDALLLGRIARYGYTCLFYNRINIW